MVARGGINFIEHREWGRRPVLVLTPNATIPAVKRVTVASITRQVRGIPTEVILDRDDGMPGQCAVTLGNLGEAWQAMLTEHVTTLRLDRMDEVCRALNIAAGCEPQAR